MTPVILLIAGALLGIIFSAFASAVETGTYCLNRLRLRVRAEQNYRGARRLARLFEQPGDLVLMALLGCTLADYFCTACVTALFLGAQFAPPAAEGWATLIVTPAVLVLGGVIPKDWFRREADVWMYRLAWPLERCVRLARATGFPWAMRQLTRRLLHRLDLRTTQDADPHLLARASVVGMLQEGAALGGLSRFQRELIERVMRISSVRAGNVMIPLSRAALVARTIPRDDFLRIARMAHFSRLPVHDGDARRIVGIVHVFDVLTDPEQRPVSAHVRPPVVVAAHASVSSVLLELQRARRTMAIVQDRRGAHVGLLTLKDLVEEIVGDLEAW